MTDYLNETGRFMLLPLPIGIHRVLGRLRLFSVAICLSWLILLNNTAAHGQPRRCNADGPIRLYILFDNSLSVDRRFLEESGLSGWFKDLGDALRPGDEIKVYSVAAENFDIQVAPGFTIPSGDEILGRNYRPRPDSIARQLRKNRPWLTDLSLSVGQLDAIIKSSRPGAPNCGDAMVLVTDGSLDPYNIRPASTSDPESIAREFINKMSAMLRDGLQVYAIGLNADSTPVFERPRADIPGIRTGRDLLIAAVGADRYMPWDSATVKTLVQGGPASLFPSMLGLRGDTLLKPLLGLAGFGYIVYRMKSDSVDGYRTCRTVAGRNTITGIRLGSECWRHVPNPKPDFPSQLAKESRNLAVFQYGSSHLLNFDATPDSVYDPLQIIATRYPSGDQSREPCTQATLLDTLSRYGWPPPNGAETIHGRFLSGPNFVPRSIAFVQIPHTNCYALADALSEALPRDSTFVVTLADGGNSAMTVLHRAQSPVEGALFRSMQPLLSALFRRHEYSVTGVVLLADSQTMHDINIGGEQIPLEWADLGDCSEVSATRDSASSSAIRDSTPKCLRLEKGVVVEQPPNAGFVVLNRFARGDCSDAGARCHMVRIARSRKVLALGWLALAFLVGFIVQVACGMYPSIKLRAFRAEWAVLLVVGTFTGLVSAWLVDEIAWKAQTEHHLSWMLVLEVGRIVIELCVAAYSGELIRHVVKSSLEMRFGA